MYITLNVCVYTHGLGGKGPPLNLENSEKTDKVLTFMDKNIITFKYSNIYTFNIRFNFKIFSYRVEFFFPYMLFLYNSVNEV